MVLILVLDQVAKILVKTTMPLGDTHYIFGNWFQIHFIENEGMAFGMKLGGNNGKLLLSLFRIVAVIVIGWWLFKVTRKGASNLLIVCIAMIMAGTLGNIIDSAFYGLIFSNSFHGIATLFPPEGGYGTFLHGKVVVMLYFPIIESHYPAWLPWIGGQEFTFFSPVFNIADSSITIGVFMLILFQKNIFQTSESQTTPAGKIPNRENSSIDPATSDQCQ